MQAPAKADPLLHVEGVAHAFGGLRVLADVNITVGQGQLAGLIGPNGSGKTTCFNIMSGFLRPRGGRVRLAGQDITGATVQSRSRMGLVRTFQTPQVFRHMTVHENLMIGCYKQTRSGPFGNMFRTGGARRDREQMLARSAEAAAKFGLQRLLDRPAGDLPAGQCRVVELARACVGEPKILLLDEPSSGLSVPEIAVLREWIQTLHAEGLTILLVSHDMGLMTVADAISVLYFGKVIARGSMEEIQNNAEVRDAYLG